MAGRSSLSIELDFDCQGTTVQYIRGTNQCIYCKLPRYDSIGRCGVHVHKAKCLGISEPDNSYCKTVQVPDKVNILAGGRLESSKRKSPKKGQAARRFPFHGPRVPRLW